ncbi:MAG: Negative transcription regulator padR [candidate division TM6 bacterium GW2011_GWF2_37_49]|nr:MAG: Negative transcription regulator padR [candidate division TM6 bacterium GW2011_GWF2_37_49]
MLFDKPRSGYSIKSNMLESTSRFWQESDASIYPMLKTLEAEGKVTSKNEFVGKRAKKMFEITQTGKDEFLAWMALPAESETHRDELLLKLFFGANTTPDETIKQLRLKLQQSQKKRAQLTIVQIDTLAQIPDTHTHKLFWEMALKNGLMHYDAQINWLIDSINCLENKFGGKNGNKN